MNTRALVPLVAGLGIGALALKLGVNALQSAKAGQRGENVQVWAARVEIPRGAEITAEMLQPMEFPSKLVPPGAFRERDKLLKRVPRMVAPAGLPVLESMLWPPDARPGIFPKPGYRAVAIKIDESSGVDYHLEPGCFVDVLGSTRDRRNSGVTARTVVENVEVAAVGPRTSPTTGTEGEKDKVRPVRAVTLYVQPEQAKKILLAEQQGPFKLALRGSGDQPASPTRQPPDELERLADENESNQGAALEWLRNLFATSPAPQPVAAAGPPPVVAPACEPWTVKVYRGNEQETVRFRSRDSHERMNEEESNSRLFGNTPRPPLPPRPAAAGDPPQPQESDNAAQHEPEELKE